MQFIEYLVDIHGRCGLRMLFLGFLGWCRLILLLLLGFDNYWLGLVENGSDKEVKNILFLLDNISGNDRYGMFRELVLLRNGVVEPVKLALAFSSHFGNISLGNVSISAILMLVKRIHLTEGQE